MPLTPIQRVVRELSDASLLRELRKANEELDTWTSFGVKPTDPALRQERLRAETLRAEWERRTA